MSRAAAPVFFVLSALLFLLICLRSWLIPFSHDEVATFYFYIQPGSFFPFYSHIDANGHFLSSALGWVCFRLFGSSPFALRLPSTLSFLVLVYAVHSFRRLFNSTHGWLIFLSLFLLLFPFLAYFSLCRGYAPAMSCLLLASFYLLTFFKNGNSRHALLLLLFLQLALSASLTLLFVVILCTAFLLPMLYLRRMFSPAMLSALLLHAALIVYWTLYAFYLKDNGALYYGSGDSYYVVTFRSLIVNLFGSARLSEIIVMTLSVILVGSTFVMLAFRKIHLFSPLFVTVSLLILLVLTFYMLKLILGVNYPEDRTGMFFYVFFAIGLSLLADRLSPRFSLVLALPLLVILAIACRPFSMVVHPWSLYETMPSRFYDKLLREQELAGRPVTIAGHRTREFIFGFLNYRNGGRLNQLTSPEELRMNCDYAVGVKADKPWYSPWYFAVDSDEVFGYHLLKRRSPIVRDTIEQNHSLRILSGSQEFLNVAEFNKLRFKGGYIQADITFSCLSAPRPWQCWLALQADAGGNTTISRAPLDLFRYNWSGSKASLTLVSDSLPSDLDRLVVYFWNMKKTPVTIKIHSFAISRLSGPGVYVKSKAAL